MKREISDKLKRNKIREDKIDKEGEGEEEDRKNKLGRGPEVVTKDDRENIQR